MACPSNIRWIRNWGRKQDLSQTEIRQRCRAYAEKFIDIQREEFKRLGVLGEWDEPLSDHEF